MDKKIGFIGGGNMARAIIEGIISAGVVPAASIGVTDVVPEALAKLEEKYGVSTGTDNLALAAGSDILFLAVKPVVLPAVIEQIRESVKPETIVVSIAAGLSIGSIEGWFRGPVKLVRVMPNTPALVGEGMASITPNGGVTAEETALVVEIFESLGRAQTVEEKMIDIVTGVSGSSPAYVYLFIEAMADAAVAEGMPRAQAYTFAAQAVLGAAKMVLETGEHPGLLKDQVCSPGGTTIAAVCELEANGMRSAVIKAVRACVQKSRDMGKPAK